MKDSEFLELLNLYLDHEISAADAARLEAEVQTNAKRRAIYSDYCKMQKACKLLAADFQAETQPAGNRLDLHGQRKSSAWRTGFIAIGGVSLAAACVTLLIVSRQTPPTPQPEAARALVQSDKPAAPILDSAPKPAAVRGLVSVAAKGERPPATRVTLVGNSLVLSGSKPGDAVFASTLQNGEDQLSWVRDFQLVSLQERKLLEQLRFEAAPPTLRPEGRQLGSQAPTDTAVEMTAFRFLK